MLARCAVFALLGLPAAAVRRSEFAVPPAPTAAADVPGSGSASSGDPVSLTNWPEDANRVGSEMLGFWHDSKNHVFHISHVDNGFSFYDLSQKIWAKLHLSKKVFFEGRGGNLSMRFSFRRSKADPRGTLVAELWQKVGDTTQWLPIILDAADKLQTSAANTSARPQVWSPILTGPEAATAAALLGTWRAKSLTGSGPRNFTFRATEDGHLNAIADGTTLRLHSLGPVFEGVLEDNKDRRPSRFSLVAGEQPQLVGEVAVPVEAGSRWRVLFQLHPMPAALMDFGDAFFEHAYSFGAEDSGDSTVYDVEHLADYVHGELQLQEIPHMSLTGEVSGLGTASFQALDQLADPAEGGRQGLGAASTSTAAVSMLVAVAAASLVVAL
mmetsp:Transcript_79020/g.228429  ORF Transcript_79020/g.228429 Transcript_79020/m.228429 type:complete len:383 (-) Transcript_79020:353-1501(-)